MEGNARMNIIRKQVQVGLYTVHDAQTKERVGIIKRTSVLGTDYAWDWSFLGPMRDRVRNRTFGVAVTLSEAVERMHRQYEPKDR
jgi:hypothetical protein